MQKTLNSQNNFERKTKLETPHSLLANYTIKLLSSKQYGTGTEKTHRSTEQNREPRNKPILTWAINL